MRIKIHPAIPGVFINALLIAAIVGLCFALVNAIPKEIDRKEREDIVRCQEGYQAACKAVVARMKGNGHE